MTPLSDSEINWWCQQDSMEIAWRAAQRMATELYPIRARLFSLRHFLESHPDRPAQDFVDLFKIMFPPDPSPTPSDTERAT